MVPSHLRTNCERIQLTVRWPKDQALDRIDAVLDANAAATIAKRAGSTRTMLEWLIGNGHLSAKLPMTEPVVEAYLDFRVEHRQPSVPQTTREAIAFAFGHCGLREGSALVGSRMLRGLAVRAQGKRVEGKQAAPVPAQCLAHLEKFIVEAGQRDVVFLGTLVICTLARTRCAYLPRCDVEPTLDMYQRDGNIEVALLKHKTAEVAPNTKLPIIAPTLGITGHGRWRG